MKSLTARAKQASLAAVMLSSLAAMQSAYAVGTAAGTDISNTATVNFTVGGVNQTPVNSNTTVFEVDRKVDMTVTNGAATSTNPGVTNVAAIYTVTNTGNGADTFTFAPANQAGDNFDVTNLRVYQDNGGTPNAFDGTDTLIPAATPVAFIADQSIVFFIVSDIPLSATNGQNSVVRLTATTTSTATVGADNPAVVDVVFADAGSNGTEFDDNQYNITAAALAVVKSAAIITDPVNGAGANRKAIPGAVIEYTIVVTNSGGVNAASVTLSDAIPANTTYVAASMTLNAAALTDAADADAGTTTGAPVTSISVNAGTVNSGGGTATVTFRVTINN
ncbi:MAG: DUF11 domain-containing protein [Candidatus Obscuribacterales bacterium]|nr:DUF11 domain-containing protein [Steroidobacteraceae bacterium]